MALCTRLRSARRKVLICTGDLTELTEPVELEGDATCGKFALEFLGDIFHQGSYIRGFPLNRRHPRQRQVVLHEIVEAC